MNLAIRVLSALVLLGVAAIALLLGGVLLDIAVAVAAAVAGYEMGTIFKALGHRPLWLLLVPAAVLLSLRPVLPAEWHVYEVVVGSATLLGLSAGIMKRTGAASWSLTLAGCIYVGLLGYFLDLYLWPDAGISHQGLRLVGIALGGAIVSDTAAYFVGMAIGRHRFFPSVSPKKSVEGAVGGAVACTLAVALVGPALLPISLLGAFGLGVAITVAGQTGDLAESALKREAQIKDSSRLIPGHGGLLDRLDSLLFVAPVVYCYLRVIALP